MVRYLLDTNIILRLSHPPDSQHSLVAQSVAILLKQGNECYLTAQVLIELWVVATRPIEVNGLGWSTTQAKSTVEQLLERFPLAEETARYFPIWLNLVGENGITGKRTHDVRLVAVMMEAEISHILTLNPKDFSGLSAIAVIHPQDVINASTNL